MQVTEISQRRSPNPLDTFTRKIASTLITTYQKQVSPRKGFSCAYRILHRSESCSQYTKRTILALGMSQALPLIRQRFQACKGANQTLKMQQQRRSDRQRATRQRESLPVLPTIVLQDNRSLTLSNQNWKTIQDEPLEDTPSKGAIEPPDETAEPNEEQPQQRQGGLGGGSFSKPLANNAETNTTTNQNNCSDGNCDAIDCASLDCSGLDCGGADCSSLDCGSCDCSS